jgi:hypothetical protein
MHDRSRMYLFRYDGFEMHLFRGVIGKEQAYQTLAKGVYRSNNAI